MDIVLLGNKTKYTLTLPSRIEGSFFLTDPVSKNNLVVIEASSEGWKIHPSADNKIMLLDNTEIASTIIKFGDYYIIEHNGKKSVIYCDNRNDKTVKMYQIKESESIKFGSQSTCDVICANHFFKEFHFEMTYTNSVWKLNADKSAFVYINDGLSDSESKKLSYGDKLYCYGLKIIVMKGIIFINSPNDTITVNNANLKSVSIKEKEIPYEDVKEEDFYKEEDYYFNTPRIRRFIDTYHLKIVDPPAKQEQQEMPFLLVVGPMLTTGITSVFTLVSSIVKIMAKEATLLQSLPQLIMGITMLITTFLWPSLTKSWQNKQMDKANRIRKEKYLAYLEEKKKEILAETVNQTAILKENLLPLNEYYAMILNKQRTLWERKISQRDFLTVRIGIGDIPIDMDLQFTEEELVIEKDPLKQVAISMVDQAKMLHQVPIGYSFYNKIATAIMGKNELTKVFMDNVLLQLIASHSYDELKIAIFTNENNRSDWEKYKDLLHLFSNDKSIRFFASNFLLSSKLEAKNLIDLSLLNK